MRRTLMAAAATLFLCQSPAGAQMPDCSGRPDFDACMQGFIQRQQQANQQGQQAVFQRYLQTYGPWLQQAYAQYRAQGGPMSFEQFAWWNLMTANGTNPQGALDAQRNWFEGQQRANRTVQEGYDSYNRGWQDNSRRQAEAVDRYSREAIRGQSPYVDPQSGQQVMLPQGVTPNQPFNWGGEIYVQDVNGTYYHRYGNGWVPLTPR